MSDEQPKIEISIDHEKQAKIVTGTWKGTSVELTVSFETLFDSHHKQSFLKLTDEILTSLVREELIAQVASA